jgi:hypothetical protein
MMNSDIIASFKKTALVFFLFFVLSSGSATGADLYFPDSASALTTCNTENNNCFNEGAFDGPGCWLYLRGDPTANNYIYPAGTCDPSDPCKPQYDAAGICSPAAGVTGLPEELQLALMGLCGAICGFLPMYVLARNL